MKTRKLLLVALLLAFASVGFGQNTIDHLGKIRMRYNNNGIPDTLTMSFSGDTVKYNANEGFHKFNGGMIADSLKLSGENRWVKELLGGGGSHITDSTLFIQEPLKSNYFDLKLSPYEPAYLYYSWKNADESKLFRLGAYYNHLSWEQEGGGYAYLDIYADDDNMDNSYFGVNAQDVNGNFFDLTVSNYKFHWKGVYHNEEESYIYFDAGYLNGSFDVTLMGQNLFKADTSVFYAPNGINLGYSYKNKGGTIRYDEATGKFEGYNGVENNWNSLGGGGVEVEGSLTDGAPTTAEITGIVGKSASDVGKGYQITIKDTDGSGLLYKVESDGTDWFYTVMTKAL